MKILFVLLGLAVLVGCGAEVSQPKVACGTAANNWMEDQLIELEARADLVAGACAIDKEACQEDVALLQADVAVVKGEYKSKKTYCKVQT